MFVCFWILPMIRRKCCIASLFMYQEYDWKQSESSQLVSHQTHTGLHSIGHVLIYISITECPSSSFVVKKCPSDSSRTQNVALILILMPPYPSYITSRWFMRRLDGTHFMTLQKCRVYLIDLSTCKFWFPIQPSIFSCYAYTWTCRRWNTCIAKTKCTCQAKEAHYVYFWRLDWSWAYSGKPF